MGSDTYKPGRGTPATFKAFIDRFPEIGSAHRSVAQAADSAGPLDARAMSLVKIGICMGAGLESAYRSHIRRGLDNGLAWEEIEQAILQAVNTLGLPRTVMAWQWAQQERDKAAGGS